MLIMQKKQHWQIFKPLTEKAVQCTWRDHAFKSISWALINKRPVWPQNTYLIISKLLISFIYILCGWKIKKYSQIYECQEMSEPPGAACLQIWPKAFQNKPPKLAFSFPHTLVAEIQNISLGVSESDPHHDFWPAVWWRWMTWNVTFSFGAFLSPKLIILLYKKKLYVATTSCTDVILNFNGQGWSQANSCSWGKKNCLVRRR